MITHVVIHNYRIFRDFEFKPSRGLNVIVGDNESGKTTLLEAMNIALTGRINGSRISEVLNPFWFNQGIVREYWKARDRQTDGSKFEPPSILIEVYFDKTDEHLQRHRGRENSLRRDAPGFALRVELDREYLSEFESYAQSDNRPPFIPTEYYCVLWTDFAGANINRRAKEVSTSYIDSRTIRSRNSIDYHARQMLVDNLEPHEQAKVSVNYRRLRSDLTAGALNDINNSIGAIDSSLGDLSLQMDQTAASNWVGSVGPHVDNLPFAMIGQGKQVMLKTIIALQTKAASASCVFIEEPENHLSHTSLRHELELISEALDSRDPRPQIFITTHSSFVLNRLGIGNLHLLHQGNTPVRLHSGIISKETESYFQRQSGFDSLRIVLAKRLVLVEGPSDEMIFTHAYYTITGRTIMKDRIDIIAQGVQGRRALELCAALGRSAAVLRDNDGKDPVHWRSKVQEYLAAGERELFVDADTSNRTLEPQMIHANRHALDNLAKAVGYTLHSTTEDDIAEELLQYMSSNKTKWALNLAMSDTKVSYPRYILDAIQFVSHASE